MKVFQKMIGWLGLRKSRIRSQMYGIYAAALLIPITVLGLYLMSSANQMLNDHFVELLNADNRRVTTLLTEITSQAYSVSGDIFYDQSLKRLLNENYDSNVDFIAAVNSYGELDAQLYNAPEIDAIYIYTNNPTVYNYKQFRTVTDEIAETDWYTRALEDTNAFWVSISEDSYSSDNSNLCLVRKLVLSGLDYSAVMVTRISDSYIRSRVDTASVVDAISVDDQGIVYSSKRAWYGTPQVVDIDYTQDYYRYTGEIEVEGSRYYVAVATLHLTKTNSKMYIVTMDSSGFASIQSVMNNWVLMLVVAMLIPGIILTSFANYFARRVKLLREEMRKARYQDYNIISSFSGNDELTEAFEDLKVMVQDIKEKDAKMYEAELNEKELRNNQQIMEYKMLASQINPHYLYNTLETIRMKALTTGNREVADAVKILGKTLHYVQENTGTAFTTLKKELVHVENYLAIQKLRFGDRINHQIFVHPDVDPESYHMLPLLLQPVVENAVVHGLEVIDGTGLVRISITREGERLLVTVADSGQGIPADELEMLRRRLDAPEADPNSGIALYNIHRRIRLCYGDGFGMKIESALGQGTRVILELPADSPERKL